MKILEKLGLRGKKDADKGTPPSVADDNRSSRPAQEKIAPAQQDMCCGFCGGQGHAEKKERTS